MKQLNDGKVGWFLVRGALSVIELSMRALAGALDAAAPKRRVHGSGRVRTAAGTVEPVALDEYGRRVGAVSSSAAVKDV
jgi:hypothetical protein